MKTKSGNWSLEISRFYIDYGAHLLDFLRAALIRAEDRSSPIVEALIRVADEVGS